MIDLCSKVVDSDVQVVNFHVARLMGSCFEASGAVRVKDRVDQSCLGVPRLGPTIL
jgi:hypothetical protein